MIDPDLEESRAFRISTLLRIFRSSPWDVAVKIQNTVSRPKRREDRPIFYQQVVRLIDPRLSFVRPLVLLSRKNATKVRCGAARPPLAYPCRSRAPRRDGVESRVPVRIRVGYKVGLVGGDVKYRKRPSTTVLHLERASNTTGKLCTYVHTSACVASNSQGLRAKVIPPRNNVRDGGSTDTVVSSQFNKLLSP